jgi:hypothetical protein
VSVAGQYANVLEKIKIVKLDDNGSQVGTLLCMYNPTKLVYKRSTQWEKKPRAAEELPSYAFKGVGPATLTIELFFDTTMDIGGSGVSVSAGQDVRHFTDFLISLTKIDPKSPNKDRPPYCQLIWGLSAGTDRLYFDKGVATSVSVTYEMFLPDGTPVRAKANVTFEEVLTIEQATDKKQNPTSRSEARRVWIVEEGQTLDWIAYQEYGDSSCWRHIAETNALTDPRDLRSGQVLKLVPLP